MRNAALLAAVSFVFVGCATMDVPQAYRGRMFDRSGPLTIAKTGQGFIGPVLNPGTYSVGYYNEVMTVDCSTVTQHDPLTVLTKDGVQFGLDMYVRFSANCSDDSVRVGLCSIVRARISSKSAKNSGPDTNATMGSAFAWSVPGVTSTTPSRATSSG